MKKLINWLKSKFTRTQKTLKLVKFNSFVWVPMIIGSVVGDIVEVVMEWVTQFWTMIIYSINSAIALVYNPSGATLADRITFIGYLALFGLAIGIVKLGMGFVMKFFKKG